MLLADKSMAIGILQAMVYVDDIVREIVGSYNQSKGRSGSYSINHQQSGRDLMTPDEVRLLDNSKCILFIRGCLLYTSDTAPYQ